MLLLSRRRVIKINNTNIQRIQDLTKQLNIHRNEYYNLNGSSISDKEYDKLFDELKKLEQRENFVMSNSPTQTVGFPILDKLQKRVHLNPLKSLDKTKSIDELNKWKNYQDTISMLKADGLTVEIDFENGVLTEAATRGNGEIGELITSNALSFRNIPKRIPFLGKLRLVGEAIIHRNDFDEINSKLPQEEKYKTPRNLVSGSVRQLDSKICSERNVHWYAFNILEAIDTETGENVLFDSKYKNFLWLMELSFVVIPIKLNDINNLTDKDIEDLKQCSINFSIPIDGLVISYDSIKYSASCGETEHHPLHSLALKFEDEMEETVLREVEWNTTRSGQINPTAIFDTVILDNTEVSRASLFNLTFIEGLQLKLGSRIKVSKRNMIIPYIEENLDKVDNIYDLLDIPSQCPSCGSKTEVRNTGSADFLYCTNTVNCPAILLDKFVNFVKRDAMNIEGLSEATLEKFINLGWLKNFSDIYKLEQYKDKIVKLEGFGKRSYEKLIEAIEKSKSVDLSNFLVSLGIPQIGTGGAKRLAKHFDNDIDKFLHAINYEYDFTEVEDFGQITADALVDYFEYDNNFNMIRELLKIIDIKKVEKKATGYKSLDGLTFVVTGSIETFKNRGELEELITSLNGKLSSGVSSKTNYLINNDTESTSGKNKKAKELGVQIISEGTFNEMIGRKE